MNIPMIRDCYMNHYTHAEAIIALFFWLFAASCTAALGSVIINEMELNPPDSSVEWIEIYNNGSQSTDISGWTVSITDGSWIGRMDVPAGTVIVPNGFFVAAGERGWKHNDGGYATLTDASGAKVDETPYRNDPLNNDMTFGRYPDGHDTNTKGDWGYMMGSMGEPNEI